jgi:hypothetical protein
MSDVGPGGSGMGMLLDANAPLEAELAERHGGARRAL